MLSDSFNRFFFLVSMTSFKAHWILYKLGVTQSLTTDYLIKHYSLTVIATGGASQAPPHQFYQDSYQSTQNFSTKLGDFS